MGRKYVVAGGVGLVAALVTTAVVLLGDSRCHSGFDCSPGESCTSDGKCVKASPQRASVTAPAPKRPSTGGPAFDVDAPQRPALIAENTPPAPQAVPQKPDDTIADAGLWCAKDEDCAAGHRCHLSRTPPACDAPGAAHVPCTRVMECASGLTCNEGYRPAQCEAPGGAASKCGNNEDCGTGLSCNTSVRPGECRYLHSSEAGAPCSSSEECKTGLTCNRGYDPPTCRAVALENAHCTDDSDCGAGLHCNIALLPPACLPPGKAGTPCVRDVDCQPTFMCPTAKMPPWQCALR